MSGNCLLGAQERRRRNPEGASEFPERIGCWVRLTSFDPDDAFLAQPSPDSELKLREPSAAAQRE